jgi:hypothetical protein
MKMIGNNRLILLLILMALNGFNLLYAQKNESEEEAKYNKTINERAQKIVVTLNISDSVKFNKVTAIIANQYKDLRNIHDSKEKEITIARQRTEDKAKVEEQIRKIDNSTTKKLTQLHKKYLSNLSKELTPSQIEQVKDGMTYGVLPITYNGYIQMIPTLTEVQKTEIKRNLTEAREFAMDAGSSEEKHKWFGKYKGRINNYLSKEGYDLKKEEEGWARRRETAEQTNKQ